VRTRRAAVVGAAGFTGAELMRFIVGHPDLELVTATSAADAGRRVDDVYPALAGVGLEFTQPDADAIAAVADVAFLAVPHTAAMAVAAQLLAAGVTVIDLSADFRLTDVEVYERWYDAAHTSPDLLVEAVYGLPELGAREALAGARLVACPGCYPTATLLAAAPALDGELVVAGSRVIADAKSGVSGAGRTPSPATHFCSADGAVSPYKVASHRHMPEISQELARIAGAPVPLTFAPHLVPMDRGLLSTVYLEAADSASAGSVLEAYRAFYDGEPFVRVHEAGRMPSTAEVRGSNRAHIGVAFDADARSIIVACAIDNLGKGAAGQAVQCANIALGLSETAGLVWPAPVV
jgi:N-acetyl-gamma-glutamyl-phosphate reductase